MQDIPMFTSEYGVASLFLKEVSYRGRAHIKISPAWNRINCWKSVFPSAGCAVRSGSTQRGMNICKSIL